MPTQACLVTPERVLFEGEADFVVMRTEGGEIMFLPNHAPFVAAVDITVVRIAPAGSEPSPAAGPPEASSATDEVKAAVHGGYVHVADNAVLVLAGVAELADEIDVDRARRALERAEAELERGGEPEAAGAGHRPEVETDSQAAQGVEQSQTMLALVYPDDPSVAARRARVRLEAAGALESRQPAHA